MKKSPRDKTSKSAGLTTQKKRSPKRGYRLEKRHIYGKSASINYNSGGRNNNNSGIGRTCKAAVSGPHGAMRSTNIVTSFVRDVTNGRILILKRSDRVRTMRRMWSGISGIIEGRERPFRRAIIEIFEETGIASEDLSMASRTRNAIRITSPQYRNHEWRVFAFLFDVQGAPAVRLNWENTEYKWVDKKEIKQYRTVPDLYMILRRLL